MALRVVAAETFSGREEHADRRRARVVDVAVAAEKVITWAAGVQARAAAELHADFTVECASENVSALTVFEAAGGATSACLSLALGISRIAADRLLAFGLGLARLPQVAEALSTGRIKVDQARLIQKHSTVLPVELSRRLADAFVADPRGPLHHKLVRELRDGTVPLWSMPAHRLRPILERRIAVLAPEALEGREQARQRGRHVEHYASTADRDGALVLSGPDHLLAGAFGSLDAAARKARRSGDARSLDQLRFDTAVAAITSSGATNEPTVRAEVSVVMPATMLMGLDDLAAGPAFLRTPTGDLPISAGLARELADDSNATWRRLLCDPVSGVAVDVSPRYAPTRSMARLCGARDGGMSRYPTSGARVVELDHVEEYDHRTPPDGGPTTPGNLASLGKREHQAKTDRLVDVSGDANGVLTFQTRAGHGYPSHPYRYFDSGADPPS